MNKLTSFQQTALDFHSNIALSANAGSGKTFVLSKRFVEILLEKDVEMENIVAITFTDKAAGELYKKIANELEERFKIETDITKQKKLENARRSLVSANISTIHSFCIDILKEFAPEAQIDTNFTPIDKSTSDELIELVVEESVSKMLVNNDYEKQIKYLIRTFGSKRNLVNVLLKAIEQRKIIENSIFPLYEMPEVDFISYLNETFEKYFIQLFKKRIDLFVESITVINNQVLVQKSNNEVALELARMLKKLSGSISVSDQISILTEIDKLIFTASSHELKKRDYLNNNRDVFKSQIYFVENLFDDINQIIRSDFSERALKEYYRFGKYFCHVIKFILDSYSNKKASKGYLDFEDLLLFARTLLKRKEVQDFLGSRYKFIMIDEYQDTNELQYEIFMPILDYLNKGNLFVVGDEKQSIYMFRDAELEIFDRTKKEITAQIEKGKVLELPHNFRMVPQLILFTNKIFEKLFSNPNLLLNEVEYSELIGTKDITEKGVVEIILAEDESTMTEADMVANKILELISNAEIKFQEVAILCRKRSMFSEIEASFVKKQIPYTVLGGKGFFQKQSIRDVHSYLSFLMNNDDDVALLSIIRSPFYSFSDRLILEISLEEGNTFFAKLKNYSNKNSEVKKALTLLNSHREIINNSEIYSVIRKILTDTGYWAVLSSKKNSVQELANMEKLISIARDFSNKSFKNLYDFITFLKDAIEMVEDEGQAQLLKEDDTVKLITIHQAKGLEFKTVFIYGCHEYTMDDTVKSKSLNIDKNFGFVTKVFPDNQYFYEPSTTHISALHNYINYRKNIAETKRLFYVAITRAISNLYLSAKIGNKNPNKNSFLALLTEALGEIDKDISLSDKVKIIDVNSGSNKIKNQLIDLDVKIKRTITEQSLIKSDESDNKIQRRFMIEEVLDLPKKEFISATKISMFNQCPVKYELTYELGYSSVYKLIKSRENQYEFNNKEDDEVKPYADVIGRIVHAVLSHKILPDKSDYYLEKELSAQVFQNEQAYNLVKSKVNEYLNLFYNSNSFYQLQKYDSFENELEVYAEEGEHYLYGIIDKLIYIENKLLIVDYKTDKINESEISNRAVEYFHQLEFYAYILSKLCPNYKDFQLRLIFLKHPDILVQKDITVSELNGIKKRLSIDIQKIIGKNYKANLTHCSKCHFSLDGVKCIKA